MLDVLFVCTRNSAPSLIAESILRSAAKGRFRPFSAGCAPATHVSPRVLAFLDERQLPGEGLRPKSLEEFRDLHGTNVAFVITLSEPAAAAVAVAPWPSNPVIAHWCLEGADDGDLADDDTVWAIRDAFWVLSRRIKIFASLPHGKASRHSLEHRLHALESWQ